MTPFKGAAGAISALTALCNSGLVQSSALVLVGFILVDTLAGLWLAGLRGELRSHKMTKMLVSKLVQYSIILTLSTGAAFLAHSDKVLAAGINGISAIEFMSLTETAIALQAWGVNLGPLRPLLERIRKYFPADLTADSEKEQSNGTP